MDSTIRAILSAKGFHIETVKRAGHSMAWENPQGLARAILNGLQCICEKG